MPLRTVQKGKEAFTSKQNAPPLALSQRGAFLRLFSFDEIDVLLADDQVKGLE